MTMMSYGGYHAAVEFVEDAGLFHGEVIGLRDVITFQGCSVDELRIALKDSIEDYLAFCRSRGEEPERPFSGQFVVRISPDTHRHAAIAARRAGLSLNAWVKRLIDGATAQVTSPAKDDQRTAKTGAH